MIIKESSPLRAPLSSLVPFGDSEQRDLIFIQRLIGGNKGLLILPGETTALLYYNDRCGRKRNQKPLVLVGLESHLLNLPEEGARQ